MKNICNKLKWLFLFSFGFSNIENPLKRIVTLTSRQAIEISPHNKKLLDQQIKNQEESSKKSKEESDKIKINQETNENSESSETKFNKILFSSAPGEVEETEIKTSTEKSTTTKIENPREINETSKVENKIKKINVISSKVDKQIFFDVVDKIQDEEIQRNYLQNLKKFNSHWKSK